MTTLTENGAVCYTTSGNNFVDLFMYIMRDLKNEMLVKYLENCYTTDKVRTLAIIFNCRDRLSGKKEKKISNDAMIWVRNTDFNFYSKNIKTYITNYGCWKDVLYINKYIHHVDNNDSNDDYELVLIAEQLKEDLLSDNVSLCAKWSPSYNDKNDKKYSMAKRVANILYKDDNKRMEKYRKNYLSPLRNKINIVESLMCSNQWDKIEYKNVPSVAIKRLNKAFIKHDKTRYEEFLSSVKSGQVKMKTSGILPHELVEYYIKNPILDETIELQWKEIVNNIKELGCLNNTIPIVDLSGSMLSGGGSVVPLHVSIALGLLIASCNEEFYKNKFITFSSNPRLITLDDNATLLDNVKKLKGMDSGTNTNFESTIDLLINAGKMYDIPDNMMPKKIICLSDMQFDEASYNTGEDVFHDLLINKYNNAGYSVPTFIYWNLNTKEGFPIKCNNENCVILSGYSEQLLKVLLTSKYYTPEVIMDEILKKYIENIQI